MRAMRSRIVLAIAALLIVVGATVAFAAIPHSTTGVITGCYKTNAPLQGSVRVVDAEAGATCPSGYTQLTWTTGLGTVYALCATVGQ